MDHVVYYLNVSINGYDTEVFVNDAPIVTSTTAYPCIAFPTVSEWVINGENEIKVVISGAKPKEPEDDSEARAEAEGRIYSPRRKEDLSPIRLKVALGQGELGTVVDLEREDVICALSFAPPGDAPPELPQVVVMRHAVTTPYGRYAWQDAAPITLDKATRAEIWEVVRALHADMGARRVDLLASMMRVKFDEVGRCYDLTPEEARAKMDMGFAGIFEPEAWALADIDPEELDPRLCCGGRVVEVRNKDGRPTLRQREPIDEEDWAMPLFLSKVGGVFVIVR